MNDLARRAGKTREIDVRRDTTAIQPRSTAAIILAVIAAALWSILNILLVNFYVGNTGIDHGGDSGQLSATLNLALALVVVVGLWLSLALLQGVAFFRGALSGAELAIGIGLLVLSAIAAFRAQSLLTPAFSPGLSAASRWPHAPWAWPLLEPALAPPLFVALSFWALSDSLRARLAFPLVKRSVWIAAGVLSLFVFVL